jgi:hypothetical protein
MLANREHMAIWNTPVDEPDTQGKYWPRVIHNENNCAGHQQDKHEAAWDLLWNISRLFCHQDSPSPHDDKVTAEPCAAPADGLLPTSLVQSGLGRRRRPRQRRLFMLLLILPRSPPRPDQIRPTPILGLYSRLCRCLTSPNGASSCHGAVSAPALNLESCGSDGRF